MAAVIGLTETIPPIPVTLVPVDRHTVYRPSSIGGCWMTILTRKHLTLKACGLSCLPARLCQDRTVIRCGAGERAVGCRSRPRPPAICRHDEVASDDKHDWTRWPIGLALLCSVLCHMRLPAQLHCHVTAGSRERPCLRWHPACRGDTHASSTAMSDPQRDVCLMPGMLFHGCLLHQARAQPGARHILQA